VTGAEVLSRAHAAGAVISRYGRRLRYRVPSGPLAGLLITLLNEHKDEILELLSDAGRVFTDEEEILWRVGRLWRQVRLEGRLPGELLVRPGLLWIPDRCSSCGELFASGPDGRLCPACEDAVEIVKELDRTGELWAMPAASVGVA
jgi:hypothetical protein